MSANHFFVDPAAVRGEVVEIAGAEAHHAAQVLRVRPGEAITVADGTGRVYRAVVTRAGDVLEAEVRETQETPLSVPQVTLYQGIARKPERMETVIEKAVEIGIARIVPFVGERTVVRWDERKQAKAHDRWSAIARAAAKQSRSARLPKIEPVRSELDVSDERLVVALHESCTTRLRDALPVDTPSSLALVVGPEGGLTDGELDRLRDQGAPIATLGERILRTETAGLVAAAIVSFRYGNLG